MFSTDIQTERQIIAKGSCRIEKQKDISSNRQTERRTFDHFENIHTDRQTERNIPSEKQIIETGKQTTDKELCTKKKDTTTIFVNCFVQLVSPFRNRFGYSETFLKSSYDHFYN
jgi:hypothetical protein